MNRRNLLKAVSLAGAGAPWMCLSSICNTAETAPRPSVETKARPLFNGKDLDGWETGRPDLWVVEEGMILGRSPGILNNEFLFTKETFGDFRLRYEARLVEDKGNSGVQIRSARMDNGHAKGYQVDIGKGYWGSLYHEEGRGMLSHYKREEGAADDPVRLDGFNVFEVHARGHRITVHLNGTRTVDLDDPQGELEGRIALQIHSGGKMEVQFRKIEIRGLNP